MQAPKPTGAARPQDAKRALTEKQTARFLVNALVPGGQDAPAFGRVVPIPGRDDAAGALDDRRQRDNVMRLEIGLDHEINEARRQRAIGIAIAAVARKTDPALDAPVGRLVGIVTNEQRARRGQCRLA